MHWLACRERGQIMGIPHVVVCADMMCCVFVPIGHVHCMCTGVHVSHLYSQTRMLYRTQSQQITIMPHRKDGQIMEVSSVMW